MVSVCAFFSAPAAARIPPASADMLRAPFIGLLVSAMLSVPRSANVSARLRVIVLVGSAVVAP